MSREYGTLARPLATRSALVYEHIVYSLSVMPLAKRTHEAVSALASGRSLTVSVPSATIPLVEHVRAGWRLYSERYGT